MSYTTEQLKTLQDVQTEINIILYDDIVGKTEEFDEWFDTPPEANDQHSFVCRDYVLAKAQKLRSPPINWNYLEMTVILCYTELKEYHAVLGVQDTNDSVTWVLDNRVPDIYQLSNPPYPYTWAKRQVPGTDQFKPME